METQYDYDDYATMMQKYKESEKRRRAEASKIPRKFWDESFETYKADGERQKLVLVSAKEFAASPKNRLLLLCGNNGTGKTHLASAIVKQCGGIYTVSLRLCVEYESAADYKAKRTRLEILDYYSAIKMLVIDEVGRNGKEQTEKEILPYIISQRYENELPTVVVSNMLKKDIAKYFGQQVFDRMTEICTSLEFDWESMRLKKRQDFFGGKETPE